MTSEVENILNGQVVRGANASPDKAIGVSTANLLPDEKGEVPLSKQSAFQIVAGPTMTETPAAPVAPAEPEVSEELDLTPSAPVEAPTAPEAPAAPAAEAPVEAAPEVPAAPVVPEGNTEPVAPEIPAAPAVSDTISEAPVDVEVPTGLSEVNFDAIIPNIPLVDERQPADVPAEEEKTEPAVELPQMPDQILAEAPTSVDNNLFVDAPAAPEVPAAPVAEGDLFDNAVELNEQPAVPAEGTPGEETPAMTEEPTPEAAPTEVPAEPVEPLFPDMPTEPVGEAATEPVAPEEPAMPEEAEVPGVEFTDTPAEPEAPEAPVAEEPASPVEGAYVQPNGMGVITFSDEKLQEIIDRLDNIYESVNGLKEIIVDRDNRVDLSAPAMPEVPMPAAPTMPEAPAMPQQILHYQDKVKKWLML